MTATAESNTDQFFPAMISRHREFRHSTSNTCGPSACLTMITPAGYPSRIFRYLVSLDKIPIFADVYKAASITLFVISIIIAIARTAIRLRYQRRLFVDDAILLVAIVCLCAAMTLLLVFAPSLYAVEAFITGSSAMISPEELVEIEVQLERPFVKFLKLSDTYYVMTWTSIFAVKFSFLFFFRVLIRRVRAVTLYWQIVSVVTVLVWVYCIAGAFIICPYFDFRACEL